ncbi:MAG: SPOR domain-containing protein [Candidatus Amulumruptor caecigallinarius]|nr:SPOR domain-containing protein [Candidatus Amulumruptor caecigallinarius]MCM1397632.1 SPOR domain-containing protein [Candidatus Amulumruptor caecigallinarius]MCM1454585.1 SPOR domain-containing protein [bacterium]
MFRTALKALIVAATFIAGSLAASAQQGTTTVTIVDHITAVEGNSVDQPTSLANLLKPSAQPVVKTAEDKDKEEADKEVEKEKPRTGTSSRTAGYRVQVYSDGNQRTAKAETQRKAAAVSSRFPNMRTYTSYSAPFWRLRVGDFRTRREAEDAAASLRSAFPAYRNEIRVVRDRINARD